MQSLNDSVAAQLDPQAQSGVRQRRRNSAGTPKKKNKKIRRPAARLLRKITPNWVYCCRYIIYNWVV